MMAGVDFCYQLGPRALAMAGWLAQGDAEEPLFALVQRGHRQDVSQAVFLYDRVGLDHVPPEQVGTVQTRGFFAVIETSLPNGRLDLAIGTTDQPARVRQALSQTRGADLEQFFWGSPQSVRLRLYNHVMQLRPFDAVSSPVEAVVKLGRDWLNGIEPLPAAPSSAFPIGIERALMTPQGFTFIEGWIDPPKLQTSPELDYGIVGLKGQMSRLIAGAMAHHNVLEGDKQPAREGLEGFVLLGRGTPVKSETAAAIIGARTPDSTDYRKISIKMVSQRQFEQVLWSRLGDMSVATRARMKDVWSFLNTSNQAYVDGFATQSPPQRKKRAATTLGTLMVVNYADSCSLSQILRVSTSNLSGTFRDLAIVPLDTNAGDESFQEWPIGARLIKARVLETWSELPISDLDRDEPVLILCVGSMLLPDVKADLRAAIDALDADDQIGAIVLTAPEMAESPSGLKAANGGVGASAKKPVLVRVSPDHFLKGATVPPVLMRASVLKKLSLAMWPHPIASISTLQILRVLKEHGLLAQLPSTNIRLYQSAPRPLWVGDRQARLMPDLAAS